MARVKTVPASLAGVTSRHLGLWAAFLACMFALSGLTNVDAAIGRSMDSSAVTVATPIELKPLPTMLVIGDSYSSGPEVPGMQHTDKVGSERRGWWSFLAAKLNYRPILSAEPGSGMLKAGLECAGSTFADRIASVKRTKPELVVVEGGRNDYRYCDVTTSLASGKPVSTYSRHPATETAVRQASRNFLSKLRDATDAIDLDPDRVYVMAPWGESARELRPMITRVLEEETRSAGFTYVDLPVLTADERYDETHPNGKGSDHIFEDVYQESDIRRFAHAPGS